MNKQKLKGIAILMMVLVVSLPVVFATEINIRYDANGNIVYDGSTYREYNSLNQLVRIRNGSTSSDPILQDFVYHPSREQIYMKRTYNSTGQVAETAYYLSKSFVEVENASGRYQFGYAYHEGQLVGQINPDGSKLYMHADHEGSMSVVTNESGNIVETTLYSPYGEILSGSTTSRFDYEGKEFDSLVGDIDFNFRKYCVKFHIFCQGDTLIQNVYNPQDLNRYSFESNNPYRYTDPTGHFVYPILHEIALWLQPWIAAGLQKLIEFSLRKAITKAGEEIKEIYDEYKEENKEDELAEPTPPDPLATSGSSGGLNTDNPTNTPNALTRTLSISKQNVLVQNMIANQWNIQLTSDQAQKLTEERKGSSGSVKLKDGAVLTTVPGYEGIVKITPVKDEKSGKKKK